MIEQTHLNRTLQRLGGKGREKVGIAWVVHNHLARRSRTTGQSSPTVLLGLLSAFGLFACANVMQADATRLAVASVIASVNDVNVPQNTLDGSLSTRWSAEGNGQWIRFDLGTRPTTTVVKIAWYKGDQRISRFDVQTSDTATSWTTVYSGSSSGKTTALESYDVTDWVGRYVRIVGHGNTYNLWNSITEVQIYGTPATSTPTNPTPPPPPPPTTVVAVPADVLNLTNWKLTLPVDTSRAGSPDEVTQTELDSYQDPNFFKVNSALNGVVFTAPCGGTTTSGSGYPRSELREMISNGTTRASWSTTSGTHTMEITQAITHLPAVKPHVVAGQIHDAGDDVIVFRLEGSTLFVDQNGNRGPVLTSSYHLGDIFKVKFVARNGGVEVYYNGGYIYTYKISTSGCYFKAGCYTQSNTSKGDAPTAYGQVVIYDLAVSHQ